jgi:hypothetical protein
LIDFIFHNDLSWNRRLAAAEDFFDFLANHLSAQRHNAPAGIHKGWANCRAFKGTVAAPQTIF